MVTTREARMSESRVSYEPWLSQLDSTSQDTNSMMILGTKWDEQYFYISSTCIRLKVEPCYIVSLQYPPLIDTSELGF